MQVEYEALKRRLFDDNSVGNVKFYPGSFAEATEEDYAREINKFFESLSGDERDVDLAAEIETA